MEQNETSSAETPGNIGLLQRAASYLPTWYDQPANTALQTTHADMQADKLHAAQPHHHHLPALTAAGGHDQPYDTEMPATHAVMQADKRYAAQPHHHLPALTAAGWHDQPYDTEMPATHAVMQADKRYVDQPHHHLPALTLAGWHDQPYDTEMPATHAVMQADKLHAAQPHHHHLLALTAAGGHDQPYDTEMPATHAVMQADKRYAAQPHHHLPALTAAGWHEEPYNTEMPATHAVMQADKRYVDQPHHHLPALTAAGGHDQPYDTEMPATHAVMQADKRHAAQPHHHLPALTAAGRHDQPYDTDMLATHADMQDTHQQPYPPHHQPQPTHIGIIIRQQEKLMNMLMLTVICTHLLTTIYQRMNHPLKPTRKDSKRCLKKHKKLLSRIRATVRTTCYNLMIGIDGTQAASCALCKLANRFHLSTHGANSSHPFTVNQFNSTLHVYCTYQVAANRNKTENTPCTVDPLSAARAVYLAWLLLAAGDVEANPGPINEHYQQARHNSACQIYSLNNAAGHEWVTMHDIDHFYDSRLLQLTDFSERGAWLMARGAGGYSDEVIEMYLRVHYGLAVQSIAQLNQPNDWTANNLGNLACQYGTHTFLCRRPCHSMAMTCKDGTWHLLDSMKSTPTPISLIPAAAKRTMHQLFVITPNTRSREQIRLCEEKGIHNIISHAEHTSTHNRNTTAVEPTPHKVTAQNLAHPYMERQYEECCLVHAFNMAMGKKCIDYHAVINHCKQLAEHLQHLAQAARDIGNTVRTFKTEHIYHANGKFSSDTLNHYLYRKHQELHTYLHPASTYLPIQSITPEVITAAIASTGATCNDAVILLSYQHATTIKHTQQGWHQLDSFHRMPKPLSTPDDWGSLQGNLLTICTGNVRHTRFIRREIWIADPLEAATPSAVAEHFRDHLDPIDLTTDHTEARETPGPLHETTTTAETSCTTDSTRRATAEGIPPHDEPTRLRQRRDTPTVTLRPQTTRIHRPTTPLDNATDAAKKRVRVTKRHGNDTHTQTLMFKYLCKPTAETHNTGPVSTIDETPKPTPDIDLGTNQHHSPPPPPTPNRQHITLTTFNVRGLHRSRNEVLNLVHSQSPDILILTETMTQPRSNNPSSGWLKRVMPNYTVHRHQGHSEVLIGIRHDLAIQMQATMIQPCTDADVNTRCVILSLRQRQSEELTLVATYWPSGNNDDALPLRRKMQEHIRTATGQLPGSLILAGDINATMKTEDRSEHTEYTQDNMMREFATEMSLSEADPDDRAWTYQQPHCTSRIDAILTRDARHGPEHRTHVDTHAYLSDHRPLTATLSTTRLGIDLAAPQKPQKHSHTILTTPITNKDREAYRLAVQQPSSGAPQLHAHLTAYLAPMYTDAIHFLTTIDKANPQQPQRLTLVAGIPAREAVDTAGTMLTTLLQTCRTTAIQTCNTKTLTRGGQHYQRRTMCRIREALGKKLKTTRELSRKARVFLKQNNVHPTIDELIPDTDTTNAETREAVQARQGDDTTENHLQAALARLTNSYRDQIHKLDDDDSALAIAQARVRMQQLISTQPKKANKYILRPSRTDHKGLQALADPITNKICTAPADLNRIITEAYGTKLAPPTPQTGNYTNTQTRNYPWARAKADDPFTMHTCQNVHWLHTAIMDKASFQECLSRLSGGKAPGPDGIENEIIKMLPWEMRDTIHQLFIIMWATGCTPTTWKISDTCLLYKDKGQETDLNSYRPVGLANTVYKLWTSLITKTLSEYAEANGMLSKNQAGFRSHRDTTQQLQMLVMALEDAKLAKADIYALLVDFTSAFNTTCQDKLLWIMHDLGFPTDATDAVKDLYTGATTRFRTPYGPTDPVPVCDGNGGPPAGADPPANTPSEPDMLDKLLEAARTNPQLRAKFNAVVETFSGGSKAPDDHHNDDNPEDTPGGHMEEGEMDEQRPRYTGGDEDYILELEAQQLQIQAENEALRQALSTITSQVKSPTLPPRRPDLAGRAAAPASTRQPGAGPAGPGRAAPTGPSPLALPLPLSLGSRSIPGPDKWTDACSSTHRRALAFCDDLERHCERCRLDVASTLPAFLTGAARNTWYPSIKESYAALYADVPDWPYLRAAFCEYTGDDLRDDCNVARTKLLDGAIKMSAGMLLGQYITEFRNNLLFAGNDSMCQPLLAMVFTRGLSSALQPAVLKDLAAFKNPTLSQAMEAAKQAQRNVVMLSTTTPTKGAGTSGVHAVQASSALGGEAHPGRRGSKPPVSGGAGKRPRHDELWSKKPLLPGQYCFKCNHPGHLTNHPCPFRHFTAIEARRRSGYPHPPEGAKKPGQAKSKPPSESGASESDQEPEPQPPPKASRPRDQGMRRGVRSARIATNLPGPEVVYTPLSAKTAAKWLKDGGTGVVALVSYENLQDPPGVPPEQAAQLKSLLMEFSDVFEPITGLPPARDVTISDRGATFNNQFWIEVRKLIGVDPAFSTAYHPQSDGQTERTNQIVEEMLRHYILPTQEDWPRHLAFAEFAIDNSWQESIQSTPFLVNYGQSPITPVLHKLPRPCLSPSAESFAKKWEHEVKHAQECMRVAQDRQQRYANKRRRDVTFSVGDSVLLSTKNLRNAPGRARKFLPRYVGPFKVTGKLGEAAYRLELPPTMSRLHPVFHVSLLKKYTGSQGFHPPPVMEWLEDAPHYEVHSLLSHRQVRFKKRMEYLVKWTGYDDTYNTWEPEAMLAGAPQILSRRIRKPHFSRVTEEVNGGLLPAHHSDRGTIQGDSLSPFLFLIYIEPLLRWLQVGARGYKFKSATADSGERATVSSIDYADDIAILCNTLRNLRCQADKLSAFSDWGHLIISHSKTLATAALHHSVETGMCSNAAEADKRARQQLQTVSLQEKPVTYHRPTSPFTYLGVLITMTLDWKPQHTAMITKLRHKLERLRRSFASARQAIHIIRTAIIPSLAYSFCAVPCTPGDLELYDRSINQCVKLKLRLPLGTPNAIVREDAGKLGMGISSTAQEYHARNTTALTHSLQSTDVTHAHISRSMLHKQITWLNTQANIQGHRMLTLFHHTLRARQLVYTSLAGLSATEGGLPLYPKECQTLGRLITQASSSNAHDVVSASITCLKSLGITHASELSCEGNTHIITGSMLTSKYGKKVKQKHIIALNKLAAMAAQPSCPDATATRTIRDSRNTSLTLPPDQRKITPWAAGLTELAPTPAVPDTRNRYMDMKAYAATHATQPDMTERAAAAAAPDAIRARSRLLQREQRATSSHPTEPTRPKAGAKRHKDGRHVHTIPADIVRIPGLDLPGLSSWKVDKACRGKLTDLGHILGAMYDHQEVITNIDGWQWDGINKESYYKVHWKPTVIERWALHLCAKEGYTPTHIETISREEAKDVCTCELCWLPRGDCPTCHNCKRAYHPACLEQTLLSGHKEPGYWLCPICKFGSSDFKTTMRQSAHSDLIRVHWRPTLEPAPLITAHLDYTAKRNIYDEENMTIQEARHARPDANLPDHTRQGLPDPHTWLPRCTNLHSKATFHTYPINPQMDIVGTGKCETFLQLHPHLTTPAMSLRTGEPIMPKHDLVQHVTVHDETGRTAGLLTKQQHQHLHAWLQHTPHARNLATELVALLRRHDTQSNHHPMRAAQDKALATLHTTRSFPSTVQRWADPLTVRPETTTYWSPDINDTAFGAHHNCLLVRHTGLFTWNVPADDAVALKCVNHAIHSATQEEAMATIMLIPGKKGISYPKHIDTLRRYPEYCQHLASIPPTKTTCSKPGKHAKLHIYTHDK
ncbi:hypothetical protein QJQ45_012213 [Haematococcus lacustris]|nr:hypothetical protein QJQ45_012213 [Haematococcus lacustris]